LPASDHWKKVIAILVPKLFPFGQGVHFVSFPNEVTSNLGAAIAGGVIGAVTRILWEPLWLVRRCKVPRDVMQNVTSENKDLYERLVENSYKYVTFYANLAWATAILLFTRIQQGVRLCSGSTLILALAIIILIRASHVQWTYYVKYMNNFYGEDKAHAKE
jgi:hypothetical protein